MTSKITKHYRVAYYVTFILSLLLNVAPLLAYTIKAVIESDLMHEKITLTMTVLIVLIMSAISLVNKVAMRSRLWVILIGCYVCLDYIMTPLIIIAICQVIDEMIVNPLKKHYKQKLSINKEIDRR